MQQAQADSRHPEQNEEGTGRSGVIKKIRTVPLFKELDDIELNLIGDHLHLKHKEIGEDILIQGEPVSAVYIIRQGLVDILVNNDRVAQRGAMDSLGEMSCLSGEATASASARAVTPCQVWEIDRQTFLSVVDTIPALRLKMFQTITGRLQSLSHRFSEILKHIPHGIIKINLDGLITDEFSSRCIDYLGITQLAGRRLSELLFADSNPLADKWDKAIQAFASDNTESLTTKLKRLPDEVTYRHPDGDTRIFRLFYHITTDGSEQTTGFDIGIDDVTQSRAYQSELSSFQNMLSKLEQLLVLIETETGLIIQETFSHSQVGQMHFPAWKNLKGKNILQTILISQPRDQQDHFQRWLKMLGDPFMLETMNREELTDLAPGFTFETVLGKVMELSFTLNLSKTRTYSEVLGKFRFMDTEEKTPEFQYSTMKLMEEVMAAEAEHHANLSEALNEMQISLEIAQSHMTTPHSLAMNHPLIAGLIHSVKGMGQSFGLDTIATASHEVEDCLAESIKNIDQPAASGHLTTAFKALLSLLVVSKSLCHTEETRDLGLSRSREPEFRISLKRFQQIKQTVNRLLDDRHNGNRHHGDGGTLLKLKNELSALEKVKLNTVFPRLQRIITDTARLLNKQVVFKVIAKTPVLVNLLILHRLSSCLIQLVKNAVYHGIETPSERRLLGKPGKAQIELIIMQNSDNLVICVTDDGKGVQLEKTVARALQLNLIDPSTADQMRQKLPRDQILALLFEPGFSTASSMTLISGRGVGMSLIKTEMEALGGTVSIESRENSGTRVCLQVPVTLGEKTIPGKEAYFSEQELSDVLS
ncbi:MAG: ATP-binding protein [bacterium]